MKRREHCRTGYSEFTQIWHRGYKRMRILYNTQVKMTSIQCNEKLKQLLYNKTKSYESHYIGH